MRSFLRSSSHPPTSSAWLQLIKWQLFAESAFDALLFADLDVDVFPQTAADALAAVNSSMAATAAAAPAPARRGMRIRTSLLKKE